MQRSGLRLPRRAPAVAGLLVLSVVLAGCLENGGPGEPAELTSLEVYEYRFLGDNMVHPDHPYGWMVRVTNILDEPVNVNMDTKDEGTTWGPVDKEGWAQTGAEAQTVQPGESLLYLFQRTGSVVSSLEYGVQVVTVDNAGSVEHVLQAQWLNRSLVAATTQESVESNHHVTTKTVGVWVNGTSFYTNIRDLNEDASFPAGYNRTGFGGNDLRVYVYDQETSEQPPGSRDRCYSVTIAGYNELLKTQAQGTSNVRFLAPEEAYTREGAEDHSLYGDALVFLNHVVAHIGEVTELQAAPQPTGDCFDPDHTSPVPIPDLPVPVR